MKLSTFLFAAFLAFTMIACGNDSTESSSTNGTVDSTAVSTGLNAAPAGDVKLNPAHGEPGHRCEIGVGEPLTGAPAAAVQSPLINSNPAQITPVESPINITPQPAAKPATGSAAAGTNPAHGQPGHRCDIAVGAPLSTPAKQ